MRYVDNQQNRLSSVLRAVRRLVEFGAGPGRGRDVFVFLAVLGCSSLFGQSLLPHKDLLFPQVAAGDTIETMITVSNTGDWLYQGTVYFVKGSNQVWNPRVNGIVITNGQLAVSLFQGETRTFLVTGSALEIGFVTVKAADRVLDNFLEGNLAYRIKSGANVVDAVGVLPASEIYLANLPFSDFAAVALAFVNADYWSRDAAVSLRLLNGNGDLVKAASFPLVKNTHRAQFLSELLPGVGLLTKGRVEIKSSVPICVTALVQERSAQLSALPITGSPVAYDLRATEFGGMVSLGEITLWVDGYFVRGYMRVREFDNAPTDEFYFLSGQLVDGTLTLAFHGSGASLLNEEAVVSCEYQNFSFDEMYPTGTYIVTFLADHYIVTGTFELTKH